MAGSFNKITLVGNLGREPEQRFLPSGDPVTDFSVATTDRRRVNGELSEQTTWFRCSAFGKLAEICSQYLHKGSYVYIEGSVALREYTGNDGQTHTSLDVRVAEMKMLGKKDDDQIGGGRGQDQGALVGAGSGDAFGDIPF